MSNETRFKHDFPSILRQSIRVIRSLTHFLLLFFAVSAAAEPIAAIRPFLKDYCIRCHGPEKQKGDLRLDGDIDYPTLTFVYEALDIADMPPKKADQPSEAARTEALKFLSGHLAENAVRPLALRRMNRYEYEHTVQDLLGIDTPLADLLPEDGSVGGFDNVADGLSISSVLMERYLEAADTAFDGVIRRVKPLPAATRRAVVLENKENIASVDEKKGGVIEVANSFVKFTPGWPPVRVDEAHPIEDGIYQVRLAVWPHNPGNRTLSVALFVGPLFGPGKKEFMGMFDVTGDAENPRVIEFETRIMESHSIHIVPWIYPEHVTWRDKDFEEQPGVAVQWLETHGPLDQDFPSLAQKQLFGDKPSISLVEGTPIYMRHRQGVKLHDVHSDAPREDAERIIRDFAPRAFRRPIDRETCDPFVALTLDRLDQGRTFEQAVRAGISTILCAPQFLLLNAEPVVDDYSIASRMSYFLWSTAPDAPLLELAASGKLSDPSVRRAQVDRMLNDPRIERFIDSFTGQWLGLRDIDFTTPDSKLYPEFDPLLQESMLGETRGFFRHILKENLSIAHFIDSDFTLLNQRLAAHYGIDGVTGHEHFQLVKLPVDSVRGGVLGQAAVMKVTANGTSTSPVLRGIWMLENIFGRPTPPPPPGVPAVEPDIRGAVTIREQMAKHSSDASCARCHERIDPPGFALECFDPIGAFRDRYRTLGEGDKPEARNVSYRIGKPVEPATSDYQDFIDLRRHLAEKPDIFARTFVEKLLLYGTGRPISPADRQTVEKILTQSKAKDLGFRDMIQAIVESELFTLP